MPSEEGVGFDFSNCAQSTARELAVGAGRMAKGTVAYTSLAPRRDCLATLASHPSGVGQKAPWRIQSYSRAARQAGTISRKL